MKIKNNSIRSLMSMGISRIDAHKLQGMECLSAKEFGCVPKGNVWAQVEVSGRPFGYKSSVLFSVPYQSLVVT